MEHTKMPEKDQKRARAHELSIKGSLTAAERKEFGELLDGLPRDVRYVVKRAQKLRDKALKLQREYEKLGGKGDISEMRFGGTGQ